MRFGNNSLTKSHYNTKRRWRRQNTTSPKTHILSSWSWRRQFNNNNNSKQCCFKNQRWQNNPFSCPNRNPDIWSQFLSGEFDSARVGKHFTDGTMPAAAAHPGTGKRRPGQIFFVFFLFLRPNIRVREIVPE